MRRKVDVYGKRLAAQGKAVPGRWREKATPLRCPVCHQRYQGYERDRDRPCWWCAREQERERQRACPHEHYGPLERPFWGIIEVRCRDCGQVKNLPTCSACGDLLKERHPKWPEVMQGYCRDCARPYWPRELPLPSFTIARARCRHEHFRRIHTNAWGWLGYGEWACDDCGDYARIPPKARFDEWVRWPLAESELQPLDAHEP